MNYIENAIKRYPVLSQCKKEMITAAERIIDMNRNGGKLLLCGNGGSASDCEHISGEMLKGFIVSRNNAVAKLPLLDKNIAYKLQGGIPSIPLPSLSALVTAFSNDVDPSLIYAQLTYVLGKPGDIFFGISTSGNAENVHCAAKTAKAMGLFTIALTGKDGGRLAEICDCAVKVPEIETYKVQELHLPVYHAICAECERIIFGGNTGV